MSRTDRTGNTRTRFGRATVAEATAGGGLTSPQTFAYTGAFATMVVNAGLTTITVDLSGAEGGGDYTGVTLKGKGGRVLCDVTVTPGETLRVYVGEHGTSPTLISEEAPATFNGGGEGFNGAGAGGGATDIRRTPYALADRLVVAPGGGGAGSNNGQITTGGGGNGATPTGVSGQNGIGAPTGGVGGTSSAGGAGGSTGGSAGALGLGGSGSGSARGGGGGGGGRHGGGGGGGGGAGTAGGGGGGGSGLSTGVAETLQSGVRTGHGTATISW